MSTPSPDAVRLIAGIVAHMRQIVGDGACYAMLHYGALEEGKRIGAAEGRDLGQILANIDAALGQTSEVVSDDGSEVVVRVRTASLADAGRPALHGIVLGLVEGGLTAARKARYKGSVRSSTPGELVLDLRREP